MKTILYRSLYVILPITFVGAMLLMASFYYMDFNPNNWSEFTRGLIALESIVFIGVGIVVAYYNQPKN